MLNKKIVSVAAATAMIFTTSSMADTVIETSGGSTRTTIGWFATAQTITVPSDNVLMEYRWNLAARTSPGDVRFAIYAWEVNGPTGQVLFENTQPWSADGNYEVTGIDLELVEGNLYGMVIDLLGYDGFSVRWFGDDLYLGGNALWTYNIDGSWSNSIFDHSFRAVFGVLDSDGDGVNNNEDACPGTVIPEGVPTISLRSNRWALTDNDTHFDTKSRKNGKKSYSTNDTAGCSCEQIIVATSAGFGHTKFGCSAGVMDEWISLPK